MQVTVVLGKQRETISGEFASILDLKVAVNRHFKINAKPSSLRLLFKGKIKADSELVNQEMSDGVVMVMLPPLTKPCPCFNTPTSPVATLANSQAKLPDEIEPISLTTLGFFHILSRNIKVKHGRQLFNVSIDNTCTGAQVRKALADHFKAAPSNIRIIAKGAAVLDAQLMTGISEAMLLFSPDYLAQLTGEVWLDECLAEAEAVEEELVAMEKAVMHRVVSPSVETKFALNGLIERIDIALKSLDRIKTGEKRADKASEVQEKLTRLQSRAQKIHLTPIR
jgi:hypothetical protein